MIKVAKSPYLVLLAALISTAFVVGGLYARANATSGKAGIVPLTVTTDLVMKSNDLVIDQWYAGRIAPSQQLQITSELAGKIEKIYVDEGDVVRAGDVLIELDKSILQADRKRLEAQLTGIRADRGLAERRLKRQQDLEQQGFSTGDRIDEIETSLEQLTAQRTILLAQLERVDIHLAKSDIRAPFSANIQRRFADVGAVVNPGAPMLELLESGIGEIKVGVPVSVAASLKPGEKKALEIREQTAFATVLSIASAVDPVTQTVAVRLVLEGSEFRFGEFVNLQFQTPADGEGFWIPNSALVEVDRGLWSVFAVDDAQIVTQHAASVLYADNERAFVNVSGQEEIRVITTGLNRISPGMKVNL